MLGRQQPELVQFGGFAQGVGGEHLEQANEPTGTRTATDLPRERTGPELPRTRPGFVGVGSSGEPEPHIDRNRQRQSGEKRGDHDATVHLNPSHRQIALAMRERGGFIVSDRPSAILMTNSGASGSGASIMSRRPCRTSLDRSCARTSLFGWLSRGGTAFRRDPESNRGLPPYEDGALAPELPRHLPAPPKQPRRARPTALRRNEIRASPTQRRVPPIPPPTSQLPKP